jgi:hypothetical protein
MVQRTFACVTMGGGSMNDCCHKCADTGVKEPLNNMTGDWVIFYVFLDVKKIPLVLMGH